MNPHDPPTQDPDAPGPDERELAQLYRRLPQAEPDLGLDDAIRARARAAVAARRRLPRWAVGIGTAAVLVLAAGLAWRMDMSPSGTPAPADAGLAPSASARIQPASRAVPLPPPVVDEPTRPPPAPPAPPPAADMAAKVAPPPKLLQSVRPAPATATAQLQPLAHAPAGAADRLKAVREEAAPPVAAMAPAAAPAAPSAPSLSGDLAKPASATGGARTAPTDIAHRVEAIRNLLRKGRRREALDALRALRREHPDYRLPEDLRKLPSR